MLTQNVIVVHRETGAYGLISDIVRIIPDVGEANVGFMFKPNKGYGGYVNVQSLFSGEYELITLNELIRMYNIDRQEALDFLKDQYQLQIESATYKLEKMNKGVF